MTENNNRLEAFRQFRKEIRGSKTHLLVGIDVAKNKHHAFFGTASGKTLLKRLVFDNRIDGFMKLVQQAEFLSSRHHLEHIAYGLEPTADYHKPLAEYLIRTGRVVVLISTVAAKHNRQMLDGRWDKNDTKDAANIADLMGQGKCQYYDFPQAALRELRGLFSLKRKVKKQSHSLQMRIRNHLVTQYFPELDVHFSHSPKSGMAVVKWHLCPETIRGTDVEGFCRRVMPQVRTVKGKQRLRHIWTQAQNSIGCQGGGGAQCEARLLVEQWEQVKQNLAQIEARVVELCEGFLEYPYLLPLPGFGPATSAMVLAAIGDPFRFKAGKQVLRLAGLDLSASRSGEKGKWVVPCISKQGKAELRYALVQAAMVAANRHKTIRVYVNNRLQGRQLEEGIKTKRYVKLAAKLLVIGWTLMKKKRPFDPVLFAGIRQRDGECIGLL